MKKNDLDHPFGCCGGGSFIDPGYVIRIDSETHCDVPSRRSGSGCSR